MQKNLEKWNGKGNSEYMVVVAINQFNQFNLTLY